MFKKLTALFLSLLLFTTSFNRVSFGQNSDSAAIDKLANAIKEYEAEEKTRREKEELINRFRQKQDTNDSNQESEKMNKELLEYVQRLQAENQTLKSKKSKSFSFKSKLLSGTRGVLKLFLGLSVLACTGLTGAYWTKLIKAWWECRQDDLCDSYHEKLNGRDLFDLEIWDAVSHYTYSLSRMLFDILTLLSGDKEDNK